MEHSPSATQRVSPVVLAAAAHPDDIEFMMAGTLLRLRDAGAEIHMWNLASGHCGTAAYDRETIIRMRAAEAEASAVLAGATTHPPLFDDLAIFYDAPSLARVAAVVREIQPTVVLTHMPHDYMEDHQNTCRLIVTALFGRGMINLATEPPRDAYAADAALYHAMPHGLRDGLGVTPPADVFVDIAPVLERKSGMLACHRSQRDWLDASQGMGAYLDEMERLSRAMGALSGRYAVAEAWRRHAMLGFGPPDFNPLCDLLKGGCHVETGK